jgi:hypothetical protein
MHQEAEGLELGGEGKQLRSAQVFKKTPPKILQIVVWQPESFGARNIIKGGLIHFSV